MKMLAMRRENDQIFGSTNSNAINNNAISMPNDTVTDNCCSNNNDHSYQEGKWEEKNNNNTLEWYINISLTDDIFVVEQIHLKKKKKFVFFKDTRLNNAANSSGLEEYVDILQVQQLLLDSTPSTMATSTVTTSNSCVSNSNPNGTQQRHRPRVNIQKATEYSTTMANTACPSTPSVQHQGTPKNLIIKKYPQNTFLMQTNYILAR